MSKNPVAIADDVVVGLTYTLKDGAGETIESCDEGEPLLYLHGHENIVSGLEAALGGARVGDRVKAVVPPEQGYGARDEELVRTVPLSEFPEGEELEVGTEFEFEDDDGEPVLATLIGLQGDQAVLDLNHPLAGETLHFEVEIRSLRAATREELKHGHPHGADGQSGHDH